MKTPYRDTLKQIQTEGARRLKQRQHRRHKSTPTLRKRITKKIEILGCEMSNETKTKPAPGSEEARAQNCSCPVIDNGHGRGYLGGVKDTDGNVIFVINSGCPLHGVKAAGVVVVGPGSEAE